ncbi:hypothetical protein ACFU7C_03935, partial [Streptomyces bacillaris]
MTKLLLSLHVLASILAVGPVTVAASMFPRYARGPPPRGPGGGVHQLSTGAVQHKICRVYAQVGKPVPVH